MFGGWVSIFVILYIVFVIWFRYGEFAIELWWLISVFCTPDVYQGLFVLSSGYVGIEITFVVVICLNH